MMEQLTTRTLWGQPLSVVVAVAAFAAAVLLLVVAYGLARSQRIRVEGKERTREVIAQFSGTPVLTTRVRETEQVDRAWWRVLAAQLMTDPQRHMLGRQLAYAGKLSSGAVERVSVLKLQLAILGMMIGLILGLLFGGWWWLVLPIAGVLGFVSPNIYLREQANKRTESIGVELPEALDLLNLCVGSGLGLQGALQQVASSQRGPVAAEFTRVLREMSLGVPRTDAFIAMAKRVRQPDMLRFIHAITQVDRLGIPLSVVIREQAREMRAKRHARAREQAQKISVKILLPLVLCFLPALFIIVLAPAIVSISGLLQN
jgi:tight adherence protein C